MHDQSGSLSVRGNNTRGSGKTQVGAGSHKKAKGKVVTLVEQSVVVLDEADHPLSDFGQGVGQFDADAIKAPLQTFKMLIECEKIARKRANLLCDGTPLDESPIVNGDRYFGCRDKLTVPLSQRFRHWETIHGLKLTGGDDQVAFTRPSSRSS